MCPWLHMPLPLYPSARLSLYLVVRLSPFLPLHMYTQQTFARRQFTNECACASGSFANADGVYVVERGREQQRACARAHYHVCVWVVDGQVREHMST
eukprot:3715290-Alexandrium_andersonii.AAC.1